VVQRVERAVFHPVDVLPGSARGEGGYGSTGGFTDGTPSMATQTGLQSAREGTTWAGSDGAIAMPSRSTPTLWLMTRTKQQRCTTTAARQLPGRPTAPPDRGTCRRSTTQLRTVASTWAACGSPWLTGSRCGSRPTRRPLMCWRW